jgi:hypothetical protein
MKQDYLWDRSGSDDEIERLEGLLSVFRHNEAAPSKSIVIEFPVHGLNGGKKWLFAVAASLAIGAFAIGAWRVSTDVDDASAIAEATSAVETPSVNSSPAAVVKEVDLSRAAIRAAAYTPRPTKARGTRRRASFAVLGKHPKLAGKPSFTKAEVQAYNQLMLALSITGSKLQIVKDSVNGFDEKDTNNK